MLISDWSSDVCTSDLQRLQRTHLFLDLDETQLRAANQFIRRQISDADLLEIVGVERRRQTMIAASARQDLRTCPVFIGLELCAECRQRRFITLDVGRRKQVGNAVDEARRKIGKATRREKVCK